MSRKNLQSFQIIFVWNENCNIRPINWHLGEGNGTPLQYSCLENPMDGGAWWAAVHGVAKSQTRLSYFTFTFHSLTGEGNGNPLRYSCLENPRDRGAWWAAVYGVAQSWTRLKRLSSSRSSSCWWTFRLLLCLGYCKQCCSEHWGACFLLDYGFVWNFFKFFVLFVYFVFNVILFCLFYSDAFVVLLLYYLCY